VRWAGPRTGTKASEASATQAFDPVGQDGDDIGISLIGTEQRTAPGGGGEASRPFRGELLSAQPQQHNGENDWKLLLLLPVADGCHPLLLRAQPASWSPTAER